ncbi:MAG: hypothetical protein J5529_10480 [Prevotella sp.]|jgi:hypothetical protein|nr:hypothetical protein [Prevotella sp.]
MKKYIKPITECAEGELYLPIMLSLNDEVGEGGQLVNSFDFDEDEEEGYIVRTPKDHFEVGF